MTRDELTAYRQLRREVEQIKDIIGESESRLYELRATQLTGLPHAHGAESDAREALIDKISQLRDDYLGLITELTKAMRRVEDSIAEVEDPTLRELLRRRYLSGETFEDIAEAMSLGRMTVYRYHLNALAAVLDE